MKNITGFPNYKRICSHIIFLLTVILSIHSCLLSQNEKSENNFYKNFTGEIGGVPVYVQLWGNRDDISGLLIFPNVNKEFHLYHNKDSSKNNIIFLEELDSQKDWEIRAIWKIRDIETRLSGDWFNHENQTFNIDLKESYPQGVQKFSFFNENLTIDLVEEIDTSPQLDLGVSTIKAIEPKNKKWINQKIGNYLIATDKSDYMNQREVVFQIKDAIATFQEDIISKYLESGKDFKYDESYHQYNWYWHKYLYAIYNMNHYVVIKTVESYYRGGAHNVWFSYYYCLDVKNEQLLLLDDIVSINQDELIKKLEYHFRKLSDISPTQPLSSYLNVKRLEPNNNYYISNDGLVFHYNLYEIAPFASGTTTITISWNELKPFLVSEFAQRMGL